ncbi:MAG: hypothetical protein ACRDJY_07435 [Thermoleophilaceae bacterium]
MQKTLLAVLAAAVVVLGLSGALAISAEQEPANKVSASGSTTEVFGGPVSVSATETVLAERVKTSKPTDLILGVTAECSITTDVMTVGSDTQSAEGTIRMWIEVDGRAVPVAAGDYGKVVFCNRLYERTTQLGSDDEEDSVRTFMKTRNANGFNWMALNVGSGTHEIVVKASLDTTNTQRASATGVVGSRTLVVEPTHSANNEAVSDLAP